MSLGRFPLLPRKPKTDKSHYGHALLVAGSDSMPGAAVLASRAALLSGAGLVTLASTPRALSVAAKSVPDLILLPSPACAGALRSSAFLKIMEFAKRRRVNAVAAGPGLTASPAVGSIVRNLLKELALPLVLDADALNVLGGRPALLLSHRAPLVLTPHEREFKRLFGVRVPASEPARRRLAKKLAGAYHGVLVLKGHRTLVTDGRRVYVNPTGNPGLAKGGTGDVLTGVIAAFLAQGLDAFRAAAWAVRFHGKAGDRLAKRTSELSVTASGLLEELPKVFRARG